MKSEFVAVDLPFSQRASNFPLPLWLDTTEPITFLPSAVGKSGVASTVGRSEFDSRHQTQKTSKPSITASLQNANSHSVTLSAVSVSNVQRPVNACLAWVASAAKRGNAGAARVQHLPCTDPSRGSGTPLWCEVERVFANTTASRRGPVNTTCICSSTDSANATAMPMVWLFH